MKLTQFRKLLGGKANYGKKEKEKIKKFTIPAERASSSPTENTH